MTGLILLITGILITILGITANNKNAVGKRYGDDKKIEKLVKNIEENEVVSHHDITEHNEAYIKSLTTKGTK